MMRTRILHKQLFKLWFPNKASINGSSCCIFAYWLRLPWGTMTSNAVVALKTLVSKENPEDRFNSVEKRRNPEGLVISAIPHLTSAVPQTWGQCQRPCSLPCCGHPQQLLGSKFPEPTVLLCSAVYPGPMCILAHSSFSRKMLSLLWSRLALSSRNGYSPYMFYNFLFLNINLVIFLGWIKTRHMILRKTRTCFQEMIFFSMKYKNLLSSKVITRKAQILWCWFFMFICNLNK